MTTNSIRFTLDLEGTTYFTVDFCPGKVSECILDDAAGEEVLMVTHEGAKLLATPLNSSQQTTLNGARLRLLTELVDGDTLTLDGRTYTVHIVASKRAQLPPQEAPSKPKKNRRALVATGIALLLLVALLLVFVRPDKSARPTAPAATPISSSSTTATAPSDDQPSSPNMEKSEVSRILGIAPSQPVVSPTPNEASQIAFSEQESVDALFTTAPEAEEAEGPSKPASLDFPAELGCSAVTADGKLLAIGGADRVIRLLDAYTLKEIGTLVGHNHNISSLAFSHDGTKLLSGSYDRTVCLWDVASRKKLRTFSGHTAEVSSVAIDPQGHYALSGDHGGFIMLWDLRTGEDVRWFLGHIGTATAVRFDASGKRAFSTSSDGTLRHWDVATGKELHKFEDQQTGINSMVLTPDGRFVITAGDNFFAKSGRLAPQRLQTLRMWDLHEGTEIKRFARFNKWAHCLALSSDGKTLILGTGGDPSAGPGAKPRFSPIITTWDVASGELLDTLHGPLQLITSVTIMPDGSRFLSTSIDRTVRLWTLK